MALTYTASVLQEHASLIEQKIEELKNNLTNRQAVPDYETYCFITGEIRGLRSTLELCDETVQKLNES